MKIGIVSDTHGNVENTARAIKILSQHELAAVIHCGDIVSADVIPFFTDWPTHFVFGNCDYLQANLRKAIEDNGLHCHERFGELRIADKLIAFLHGDDSRLFEETIRSGKYDLVCYGHTHLPDSHQEGNTLVFNPGAIHRASPTTIAVMDLETMDGTHFALSDADLL